MERGSGHGATGPGQGAATESPSDAVLIANPASGGGRGRRLAEGAAAALEGAGVSVDVRWSEGPDHATTLALDAAKAGAPLLIAAGGDGTVFEVLGGLMRARTTARRPALGLLPVGTGNSFAREFGLTHVDGAVARLLAGTLRPVDVVRVTHTEGVCHSVNLVSVGFTADAGDRTNRAWKAWGKAGYVAAVLECVRDLAPTEIAYTLDERTRVEGPATFVAFSNSRFTGGAMRMAPAADVADGRLDVIRAGRLSRAALLGAFPGIFSGRHVERDDVTHATAARVTFDPLPARPVLVDGEILNLSLVALDVLPRALEVVA